MAVTWSVKDVGTAAGKVWQFLHANEKASLSAIEKGVDAPASMIHMALGWLAREGKLVIEQEKRSILISLSHS
ncbi:MAG: winged helix-turn-helix domain-containing protein [Acidobacteriota bacterium]